MDDGQILDAAQALLAIPSTADRPADLTRALEFVIGFAGPGFTVERFESGGKPSALVYRAGRRTQTFAVILNAHLDVVPAPPWLFRPRLDGQRLYARGAQDMKISALVMAQVFAGVQSREVALQLVTDEETGGLHGTGYQLDQGVRTRFAINGESSGLCVVTESRGIVAATLRAQGRTAHSAYQWLGDNALVKLQRSIEAILTRYPVAVEEQWRTTVNVARIETANLARNQVPDEAQAWLDIRFPAQDRDFAGRPTRSRLTFRNSA